MFLKIKALPRFEFSGRTAIIPDEYASRLGIKKVKIKTSKYVPFPGLFDYQEYISGAAIAKRKYAVFVEPGFGKTFIEGEFARHASANLQVNQCVLIVTPLMVVQQMYDEFRRFYGNAMPVDIVRASALTEWLTRGAGRIGITNYDALTDETPQGRLGALVLDESSMLKSQYGKWGQICIRLGKGLDWKLAATGTPAPNDRIEYGNHAVFLDHYPTLNAFLSRFFVNRGQTDNRWELKPHALVPFYRSLAHWSIFMSNPATYGFKDNASTIPPIHVHIHDVTMSLAQREAVTAHTGDLFGTNPGGITSRSVLSQIAKGRVGGEDIETHKPAFIKSLVDSWPTESTIIWCKYNAEQDLMAKMFPDAVNISGDTPHEKREVMIREFKEGRVKILISKARILGFGLNLQIATRQIFSGLQDSYEEYYQAVKRSNRVGSTVPLNVHIPITNVERPMVETVLEKAKRVSVDSAEQERIFHDIANEK